MNNLFIRVKALVLILALLTSTLLFAGCTYSGYKGDNPELCSVAWANIPTLHGYAFNGEVSFDAEIEILETDNYGRILFRYSEDANGYGQYDCYILIMQRADDKNAYYYPDDCYTFLSLEYEDLWNDLDLNGSEITALKERNDWDKPLDASKCESTQILRKKPEGKINVSDSYFENIVRQYHENSGRYIHPKNTSFVQYFTFGISDHYGREIYVLDTRFEEFTDKTETNYNYVFLVAVNPDKSYNPATVIILDDPADPSKEVKQIKAELGWNTPR